MKPVRPPTTPAYHARLPRPPPAPAYRARLPRLAYAVSGSRIVT